MNKTNDLVNQLKLDLAPVKVQMSPVRFALWAGLAAFLGITVSLLFLGIRGDMAKVWSQLFMSTQIVLDFVVLFAGFYLVALLSNPGRAQERLWLRFSLGLMGVMFVSGILAIFNLSEMDRFKGAEAWAFQYCTVRSLYSGLVVAAVVFFMVRQRLVLRKNLTASIVALVGTVTAKTTADIFCSYSNAMHIVIYHLAIPAIVLVVGLQVLKAFFKKV